MKAPIITKLCEYLFNFNSIYMYNLHFSPSLTQGLNVLNVLIFTNLIHSCPSCLRSLPCVIIGWISILWVSSNQTLEISFLCNWECFYTYSYAYTTRLNMRYMAPLWEILYKIRFAVDFSPLELLVNNMEAIFNFHRIEIPPLCVSRWFLLQLHPQ